MVVEAKAGISEESLAAPILTFPHLGKGLVQMFPNMAAATRGATGTFTATVYEIFR